MRVGCSTVVEGHHVCPYLEHGDVVRIVYHVRCITTAWTHVYLKGNEVANLSKTAMCPVEPEDFENYQTVFASEEGSVAAVLGSVVKHIQKYLL